jgi:hypothetical protein
MRIDARINCVFSCEPIQFNLRSTLQTKKGSCHEKKRLTIHFEIRIDEQAVIESFDKLRRQWKEYLQSRSATIDAMTFQHAPVQLYYGGDYSICSEGTTVPVPVPSILLTETTSFEVHTFLLSTEEPSIEELEPSEGGGSDQEWTAACEHVTLPHLSLHNSWESLLFEAAQ